MKKYPLLSELSFEQKCHMAWRGDRYTGFGILTISKMCKGGFGDMPVNEAFQKLGMRDHQAKCHAAAVLKYNSETYKPIKS